MSKLVTNAMKSFTSGNQSNKVLWALSLCPVPGDTRGNEHISDLLLDAVQKTDLSVAQILNQECDRKILRWLPQKYARIVPNYKQFLKFMDRLLDAGAFQRELAKYEEELLYQSNIADLDDIVKSAERETRKTEFSMKLRMTGLLSKRRKEKGEAEIIDKVAEDSVMSRLTNQQLEGLNMSLPAIEVKAERVDDEEGG